PRPVAGLVSASPDAAGREPLGSAAEEAARLAETVHAWWTGRSTADAPHPPEAAPAAEGEPSSSGACRYCPLCRGVAAVHALRPEVLTHLVAAAESVAAALRELARDAGGAGEEAGAQSGGAADGARPHTDRPPGGAGRRRSVRIPVDDGERVPRPGPARSPDGHEHGEAPGDEPVESRVESQERH
ncbi:MAG: hypothetical protein ACTHN8_01285, partial [Angustibacter sp.]